MRRLYIPAVVATALLLAAPFCAGMWQPGRPAGGGAQFGRPSGAAMQSGRPSGGGARPYAPGGSGARSQYGSPYTSRPQIAPEPQLNRPQLNRGGGPRYSPGGHYGRYPGPQFVPRAPFGTPYAAPAPAQPARAPQRFAGSAPHRGDWLRRTMQLPPQEQQRRLQQDPGFRQLPPQRQQELMNRLQRFNALPPQERQRVLHRMEMIEHLPPAQQRQAHELFHQFHAMPPERRELMHRTLQQMRTMPPYARERFLHSPLTESHFTPQEMQMLRGFDSIGFASR